jgi:hypothetical protein
MLSLSRQPRASTSIAQRATAASLSLAGTVHRPIDQLHHPLAQSDVTPDVEDDPVHILPIGHLLAISPLNALVICNEERKRTSGRPRHCSESLSTAIFRSRAVGQGAVRPRARGGRFVDQGEHHRGTPGPCRRSFRRPLAYVFSHRRRSRCLSVNSIACSVSTRRTVEGSMANTRTGTVLSLKHHAELLAPLHDRNRVSGLAHRPLPPSGAARMNPTETTESSG